MDEDATQWGLVMPFVVCASEGGPYEDNAFVAGVRFGRWQELLKLQPTQHSNYEPSPLIPQLDLLAMQNGYTMTVKEWEDGNEGGIHPWVEVIMTLGVINVDE